MGVRQVYGVNRWALGRSRSEQVGVRQVCGVKRWALGRYMEQTSRGSTVDKKRHVTCN